MLEHHRRLIDRLVDELKNDPRYLAIIVGGSVAKGWAKPDSDIDIYLVATDQEFERCLAEQTLWYFNDRLADYPGGYVDGKVVNHQFLIDAADHGSEPARAAFTSALVPYSRISGLEDLITRIVVYPEELRVEKIRAFYSQAGLLAWFVREAEKREDRFLLNWAATELVFYSSRLLLAYNRILYPYRKWLMHELRRAPELPDQFIDLVDRLLAAPTHEHADAVWKAVDGFREWGISWNTVVTRFMLDIEWGWRQGKPSIAEW